MASIRLASNWRAVLAFLVFVLFSTMLLYATATGERLGVGLYVAAVAAISLGFWAREDASAVGGVIGLNFLVILDVALRIGVLP